MEGQHPIPQQISSYEFKLVGDMTLKQFVKAAAGIIIALLINKSGLLVIFKWPLMLVSAGLGLALAFVPFEDRPLEVWVNAFLKSIYSPTIYLYKKKNEDWLDLSRANAQDNEEVLVKVKNDNLFVEKKNDDNQSVVGGVRTTRMSNTKAIEVTPIEKEEQENITETAPAMKQKYDEVNPVLKDEINNEVTVEDWREKSSDLDLKKEKLEATGAAVFGNIPMPDRSDVPNVIVGMATDSFGKIIDGVIVEIQDTHGNPTRVIKTNALGQFKISTPLANGRYLMIAEKDGYIFDRVNIDLEGKIIDPVRIIAHN